MRLTLPVEVEVEVLGDRLGDECTDRLVTIDES